MEFPAEQARPSSIRHHIDSDRTEDDPVNLARRTMNAPALAAVYEGPGGQPFSTWQAAAPPPPTAATPSPPCTSRAPRKSSISPAAQAISPNT